MSNTSTTDAKPKMGRPTRFTDDLAAELCASAKAGCTPKTAAELNGISPATLDDWQDTYPTFRKQFTRARAEARHAAVQVIQRKIEQGDIDAARWFLGKMEPEVYGDKVRNEITGARGGPLRITYVEVAASLPSPADDDGGGV